jgi:glycosyltransferase involved in cell wall biosynthesis
MLVSGLMVTRPVAQATLPEAIADFAGQTIADKELVIVHDGDPAFDAALRRLCGAHALRATIERVPEGEPLGALRNRSLALAQGEVVAQWDDDDRNHPARLALQLDALRTRGAVAAFATEQIHWFAERGLAWWEDWSSDPPPLDFVQGTLVARRAALPRYPEMARGEDSALALALARDGAPLARVRDIGWSYVYRFHGGNAWSFAHHARSAADKGFSGARLVARAAILRARLAEYAPPLPALVFPDARGSIVVAH